MSNILPENDGELVEDVYDNEDSSDQFDISAILEAYTSQKTYPSINPYTGQPDISGITPVNDNSVNNQDEVTDTADRTPQQYLVDNSQNAGTPGDPIVNPTIIEEAPPPATRIVRTTSYYDILISDFSPAALTSLQTRGYKAIAVYDDGTEAEVPWSEVHDLTPDAEYILNDIEEMTLANNQHFWTRIENSDGAGSGAFITDDEQDAFIHSAQDNFADQGDISETIERTETFTSDGWTTEYNLYYAASSTDYEVTINGYEISNGVTKNTTSFVFDETPDIDATIRVTYNVPTKPWHNLLLNSYGLALRQGLTTLAAFTKSAVTFFDGDGNQASNINAYFGSDGSRIGKDSESHIRLDYHSLQLIDIESNRYLYVSDLRDHDGKGPLVAEECDGAYDSYYLHGVMYSLTYPVYRINDQEQIVSITCNGTSVEYAHYYPPGTSVTGHGTITDPMLVLNYSGAVKESGYPYTIRVTYYAEGDKLKAFTFGNRVADEFIAPFSVSFGINNTVSGSFSLAEGRNATASGLSSHAEGEGTVASGKYSHAEGYQTTASGLSSHAEGEGTVASGNWSHAEGEDTTASERWSHAEGAYTTASGYWSHAEGRSTTASGEASHAEGDRSIASGIDSHAEGNYAKASGYCSHAEGYVTKANGRSSHAEGEQTIAYSDYSHASGYNTITEAQYQFVIGKYNDYDTSSLFVIGNGESNSSRKNVAWVTASGGFCNRSGLSRYGVAYIDSAPSADQWYGGFQWVNDSGGRAAILELGHLTTGKTLRLTLSGTPGTSYQSGLIITKSYGNTYTASLNYNGDNGILTVPLAIRTQAIELQGMSSSANNGGYIDFHYNNSTADYTTRIIEQPQGILTHYCQEARVRSNSSPTFSSFDMVANLAAANNGISSGLHYPCWQVLDSAARITVRLEARINSNGNNGFYLYARQYNTSGTNTYQKGLIYDIAKSGTGTWKVDDGASFRSAIGAAASSDRRLKTNLTPLGEEAIEFINSLTAYQYDIGEGRWYRHEVGIIAQDVKAADPWKTTMAFETRKGLDGLDDWEKMKDGSPTWKLDYIRLIPPLITTVQSQAKRIEHLEKIIAQLVN